MKSKLIKNYDLMALLKRTEYHTKTLALVYSLSFFISKYNSGNEIHVESEVQQAAI